MPFTQYPHFNNFTKSIYRFSQSIIIFSFNQSVKYSWHSTFSFMLFHVLVESWPLSKRFHFGFTHFVHFSLARLFSKFNWFSFLQVFRFLWTSRFSFIWFLFDLFSFLFSPFFSFWLSLNFCRFGILFLFLGILFRRWNDNYCKLLSLYAPPPHNTTRTKIDSVINCLRQKKCVLT